MANGSLKWNNHVTGLLQQIDDHNEEAEQHDAEENTEKVEEAPVEDEEDNN